MSRPYNIRVITEMTEHLTQHREAESSLETFVGGETTLASRIALFEDAAIAFQDAHDLFRVDSWVQVMLGQGVKPRSYHPAATRISKARLKQTLAELHSNIAATVRRMPSHQSRLERLASADQRGELIQP